MKYGSGALLIALLPVAAAAQQTALPTAEQIEASYQEAIAEDLAKSTDDPMLKALVKRFEVSRIHGCQPDGKALRCLVDVAGGMKIDDTPMVLTLVHSNDSGWVLDKSPGKGKRGFPAPSPEALQQLLRETSKARLAAGEDDPQLQTAATTLTVEHTGPCRLQASVEHSADKPYQRTTSIDCEVELKPTPDSDIVKTTMQLMPAGTGWTLGPFVTDEP